VAAAESVPLWPIRPCNRCLCPRWSLTLTLTINKLKLRRCRCRWLDALLLPLLLQMLLLRMTHAALSLDVAEAEC
jgi:hypothetical protein